MNPSHSTRAFALVPLFVALVLSLVLGACQRSNQPLVTPAAAPPAVNPSLTLPEPTPPPAQAAAPAPTDLAGWIIAGNTAMDAGRDQDAIVAYTKALELDPKNVDVRVDMGTCYRNIGQPQRAIAEYTKGLEYNPRHPNAYRNSGVVYAFDLKKSAEAIRAFQKYLEVYPAATDANQILAWIAQLKAGK